MSVTAQILQFMFDDDPALFVPGLVRDDGDGAYIDPAVWPTALGTMPTVQQLADAAASPEYAAWLAGRPAAARDEMLDAMKLTVEVVLRALKAANPTMTVPTRAQLRTALDAAIDNPLL